MVIPPVHGPRPPWWLAVVFAVVLLAGLWIVAPVLLANRIRSEATDRGLVASWRTLEIHPSLLISARDLRFAHAAGDTVARIDSLDVALDPWSILLFDPRPSRVAMSGARFMSSAHEGDDETDTAMPRSRRGRPRADRLPRIRAAARRVAQLLMKDPKQLEIRLRDVRLVSADAEDDPHTSLRLDSLDLAPRDGAMHLRARGVGRLEDDTPFTADLAWAPDGRLTGGADFVLHSHGRAEHLPVTFDAHIDRDGTPRALRLEPNSRIGIGPVPLSVSGLLEPTGPELRFSLQASGLRPDVLVHRLPASLLGPLTSVRATGSFDYALEFDLDLKRPDDVSFRADVTPHGLRLDPASGLDLGHLDAPFTAQIHLPHGVIVTRELSPANPHYRPLEAIDSTLWHALVTNEDGAFFRHRGFNTDAVKEAIAENLRAGAYRRGAGTITMQLVRNLYLGHERTLARKGQEVVLAWVLEHLSGVSKRRLLELYLNIIEWGPGVHGADEACQYYFGHDAGRVSVDEALFLATVVPAPSKWKNRFDKSGTLKPFERAQMHFIGRAMAAKGWLDPALLPGSDSLRVALRGPALNVLIPPVVPDSLIEHPGALEVDGVDTPS